MLAQRTDAHCVNGAYPVGSSDGFGQAAELHDNGVDAQATKTNTATGQGP